MKQLIGSILAGVGVFALTSGDLHAGVRIEIRDTGPDVVVEASGTLDLSALTDSLGNFLPSGTGMIDYGSALRSSHSLVLGGAPGGYTLRSGSTFSGPAYPFFSAEQAAQTQIFFSTATGSLLALGYSSSADRVGIGVASSYMGGMLAASGTWSGTSLADLGLAAGSTYTWTWGSGGNADFLTVNVIPEPSTYVLMLAGLGLVGAAARRLKRS